MIAGKYQMASAIVAAALMASSMVSSRQDGVGATATPVPIVDLHVDLSYQYNYQKRPFEVGVGQFPSSALVQAGISLVVLPLFVPWRVSPHGPRLVDLETSYHNVLGRLGSGHILLEPGCRRRAGRVSTLLSFEGASALASDPDSVKEWIARGVRLFGLVHSQDNVLGTSATGKDGRRRGLTDLGRRLVQAIEDNGGLVDVSHASRRTTEDVVRMALDAGRPVVASHSNAAALANHPRNLTDAQIVAIARTGGLIGVNFHSPYLARGRPATLEDVVRHIRHIAELAGISHIAIGSDYEGDIRPARGLERVERIQGLVPALAAAGFSDKDIRQILGRNAWNLLCGEAFPPTASDDKRGTSSEAHSR